MVRKAVQEQRSVVTFTERNCSSDAQCLAQGRTSQPVLQPLLPYPPPPAPFWEGGTRTCSKSQLSKSYIFHFMHQILILFILIYIQNPSFASCKISYISSFLMVPVSKLIIPSVCCNQWSSNQFHLR